MATLARRGGFCARLKQLGQPEVRQLRIAVLRDQDVLGFDIAVNDAGSMRGREPVGHADEHVDNLTRRPLLRLRPAPKRPAVDQFRDQVLPSIVLADVIHRENVWVIERRDGSRLALKSVARSGVGEIRQEFDGDLTPQLRVERPVDDAHPAFAEQSLDAIRADQGAGLHLQAIQRGERWPIQRGARRGLRQQRLDLATQLWIGVREQRRSFGHVGVDGRLVQFFNPTPTLRIHRHSLGNRPVERWSNSIKCLPAVTRPRAVHRSAPAPTTLWPTASLASRYPRTHGAPRRFPRR